MAKFWILLTIAFINLMIAVVLVNWGEAPTAFLFLLMAALLGAYAFFFSTPTLQRDARGRLQQAEVPYSGVLGTVGAISILAAAGYVAFISSQPKTAAPAGRVEVAAPRPVAPAAAHAPPRSFSPNASGAALYKCVDANGHSSFQSQPCGAGSTQAWVRDATPEPEPTPAQRRRMALARQAAERQAEHDAAIRSGGHVRSGGTRATNPGSSAACQAARAADAAYRRQPLKYVTHDGLRQHGDRIQAACY